MNESRQRPVLIEVVNRVACVTLNRPASLNAIDVAMEQRLTEVWRELSANDNVWVIVLTGEGERAFCVGSDLKSRLPSVIGGNPVQAPIEVDSPVFLRGMEMWKPIVAVVNGYCLGGGLEMLLGTDIRVAASHATFGLPEVKRGFMPGGGGVVRLPSQIPYAVAMQMILTGESIDAERAREVGLVNEVVPAEAALERGMAIAEQLSANGPLATRAAKEAHQRGLNLGARDAHALEQFIRARVLATADAAEGVRAFNEGRPAEFEGR